MFKLYYKNILLVLFLSIPSALLSQNVGINKTAATPSTNAILDLNTGNTSHNLGLIIPNVSLTALTTFNPPMANTYTATVTKNDSGLMVYNTNATVTGGTGVGYYYWVPSSSSAGTWVPFSSGSLNNTCGTASAGYIPYFSSPTCIVNSVIFQSGTSIGVGTITPKNTLDVNGAMAVGTGYAGTYTATTNGMIVQGHVGIGNAAPNTTYAALDLTNTTTNLGMLTPRMTGAQIAAIASPAVGLILFNTSTNCYEFNSTGTPTGWNDIGCACTSAPGAAGAITVTPASPICATTSQTFTIAPVAGATSYTWTVPYFAGSSTGQGTNSLTITSYTAIGNGTVTVTPSNACGSGAASTQTVTVSAIGLPVGTLSTPGSISTFCPSTISLIGAANYTSISWSAPTTVTSAANVTAAANSTSLTLQNGTGGTGTVIATLTNACGTYTTSASVTATFTQITLDNYNEVNATNVLTVAVATNSLTVTTATNNEMILLLVSGYSNGNTTTIAIDGNTEVIGSDWFLYSPGTPTMYSYAGEYTAPLAGTHTVTVTWGNMAGYSTLIAASFGGFCSLPTAANFTTTGAGIYTLGVPPGYTFDNGGTAGTGASVTAITPTYVGSYLFGFFCNNTTSTTVGTLHWTGGLTAALTTYNNNFGGFGGGSPHYYDFSIAGVAYPTTAAWTVGAWDSRATNGGTDQAGIWIFNIIP